MAKSLNSVNLTGYLGGDPRCHTFDDGSRVANLSLAVARQKKENGEWIDDVIWVDVKATAPSGRTGSVDAIENYLGKGSFVCVTGELAPIRHWTDDGGNARTSLAVDHARVTFGPRVEGNGQQRQAAPQQTQQQQYAQPQGSPGQPVYADDNSIPW